tara:strand:+ start:16158 stop:16367 length:210 start_codon:yes stop_codon:yes gene_type:complete
MNSATFRVTARLETKLSGIYEILRKNEIEISEKINLYVKDHDNNNAHKALLIHLALNACAIFGLYYLFY